MEKPAADPAAAGAAAGGAPPPATADDDRPTLSRTQSGRDLEGGGGGSSGGGAGEPVAPAGGAVSPSSLSSGGASSAGATAASLPLLPSPSPSADVREAPDGAVSAGSGWARSALAPLTSSVRAVTPSAAASAAARLLNLVRCPGCACGSRASAAAAAPPPPALLPGGGGGSPATAGAAAAAAGGGDFFARTLALALLALSAVAAVVSLFRHAPAVDAPECAALSLPALWRGMFPRWLGGEGDVLATARRAWLCADAYQRASPQFVLAAYCAIYVGMQAFAIPGPLVLSIIAGALWGPWKAQVVIAACATSGATACYGLSYSLARPLLERAIPGPIAETRAKVDPHRDSLLYYLLFLRLTPLVPNWLINMSAPIVGIPLWAFVAATAVGLVPTNFMHASTGAALASLDLSSPAPMRDNWRSLALMAPLPLLALVPVVAKRRLALMARRAAAAAAAAGGDKGGGAAAAAVVVGGLLGVEKPKSHSR